MVNCITFEQAVWLQSIGFDSDYCSYCYTKEGKIKRASVTNKWIQEDGGFYNTTNICIAPEQHQVVEWLYKKHGIWISIFHKRHSENKHFGYLIKLSNGIEIKLWEFYSSKEAYSAAFDYIRLNNLI